MQRLSDGFDLFDELATNYATYGLNTALGPITADDALGSTVTFGTSRGDLDITHFGSGATFTASFNPVPEASTTVSFGLLLAVGLGGLMVAAKRKKMSA